MKKILILITMLLAGQAAEACGPPPTQYQLDLYFSFCMDDLLTRCTKMGYDPLLTTCGGRAGLICLDLVHDYEHRLWLDYENCSVLPQPEQKK